MTLETAKPAAVVYRTAIIEAQDAVHHQSIGYRAVLRLPDHVDAVQLAEEEVRAWLATKRRTRKGGTLDSIEWEGAGDFALGPESVLSVTDMSDNHGQTRRLIRLVERNRGTWIVSVFAMSNGSGRPGSSALVIETGRVIERDEDSVLAVAPPRIVGQILDRVVVQDGSARLTNSPQIIRRDDVGHLIDVLTDDGRTASVVVASSLGLDTDEAWTKTVESLTQYSVGVAATYVIAHDAVAELDALLPSSHGVPAGRIRTFLPSVDLSSPSDAVRHRVLGPATFARSIRRGRADVSIRAMHAAGIRRRLLDLELPKDVRRTMRLLGESEARRARGVRIDEMVSSDLDAANLPNDGSLKPEKSVSAGSTPLPVADTVPARTGNIAVPMDWADDDVQAVPTDLLRRVGTFVLRWLKASAPREEHFDQLDKLIATASLEQEAFEQLFTEAAERESHLSDMIGSLNSRIADLEVEAAIEAEEARRAARERDWLRRGLDAAQRASFASVADESEWDPPADVRELVARLTPGEDAHAVLNRVIFTGDQDIAAEIDERDGTGRYAAALWSYVRVLSDYVEAKRDGYSGNVHMYLTDDAQLGAKCSPDRHAPTESTTVINNKKLHGERVRPVPVEVDGSGRALMLAHFKPTHRDRFAPRMHYLDDAAGTGKIYIGYIGRHLTIPNAK